MKITIDKNAERRLWAFVRARKVEVGGMGYAKLADDGSIHWSDTFLIPQEVSSTEVDFESTNGDQAAIERALKDGVLEDPAFIWVSWHSHHTMKAYWSNTDDKRIEAMRDVGVHRLLSFVGCHDGEYKMRLDVFDVSAHDIAIGQVTMSGLGFEPRTAKPDKFDQRIESELAEFVKPKTYYKKDASKPLGSFYDRDDVVLLDPPDEPSWDTVYKGMSKEERTDVRRLIVELIEHERLTDSEAKELLMNVGLDGVEILLDGGMVTTE